MSRVLSEEEIDLYGLRSVLDGGKLFCGVTHQEYAINGVTYKWPAKPHLTWSIGFERLGKLSDMDMKDAFTAAFKELAAACDATFEYISNLSVANLYIVRAALDGPSGVLADCEIPFPNSNPATTRLRMRLDANENWDLAENPASGIIDAYRVILHELEHFMGLGHKPADVQVPALIAPTYSRTIRNLQAADKEELVRRYGPSNVSGPSVPPVTPGSVPITFNGVIRQGAREWSLINAEFKRTK